MSGKKKYYVYVHRYASGPKTGQVFYVGKGSGMRYKNTHGRSEIWGRCVNKYGFSYNVVRRFSNEICAFSLEVAFIAFYGRENLVNLSDGGEGPSGYKLNKDQLEKRSGENAKWFGVFGDNHPMFGLRGELSPNYGRKHSRDTIKRISGDNNHMKNKTGAKHHFHGKKHSIETINELRNLSSQSGRSKPLVNCIGKRFPSGKDAERWLVSIGFSKASQATISACARGNRATAYGFKWRFDQ